MTLSCTGNSVSLAISWLAMSSTYDMTDVQLGLASQSPFSPFLSQTTSRSSLRIDDLPPGTAFAVAMRKRLSTGDRAWTSLSQPIACSTAALQPLQPHVLPPMTPPTGDSVTLDVRLNQPEAHLDVYYRRQGDAAWLFAKVSPLPASPPIADVSLPVSGLYPGQTYEIRVLAEPPYNGSSTRAPPSDIVSFRTADADGPSAPPLDVYRVTEHCGDSCPPDLLHNHNAGDLLADVFFITAMSDPTAKPNPFIKSFDIVTVTKYCVARAATPFVDYTSCNGANPETTQCACNNYIDRCIGRTDEGPDGFGSAACEVGGSKNDTSGMPLCSCTDASMAASKKTIGMMPVFHPFPKEMQGAGAIKPLRSCTVPPRKESTFLGQWYSFPGEAECQSDHSPSSGDCSWSRRSWQHFVHGKELLALGFNTSAAKQDVPQLHQNADIITRAFDRIPRTERCCGC
jgi:hypothetical protein